MPTNFELNRLKPKLDIVEKPENRVHKLTDSNGPRIKLHIEIVNFKPVTPTTILLRVKGYIFLLPTHLV